MFVSLFLSDEEQEAVDRDCRCSLLCSTDITVPDAGSDAQDGARAQEGGASWTRGRGQMSSGFQPFTWKKIKRPVTCHSVVFLQDLSHLHQKIEKLEHLLGDNNRLVIRLHDTLDQQKKLLKGGDKANQSFVEAPLGCQLTKEVTNATDGVQVSSSNCV